MSGAPRIRLAPAGGFGRVVATAGSAGRLSVCSCPYAGYPVACARLRRPSCAAAREPDGRSALRDRPCQRRPSYYLRRRAKTVPLPARHPVRLRAAPGSDRGSPSMVSRLPSTPGNLLAAGRRAGRDHRRHPAGLGPLGAMALLLPSRSAAARDGHHHAGRHLLRGHVRRLDDLDPAQIPGEAASVITCIDGYQMAQQGPGGRGAGHRGHRLVRRRDDRRRRPDPVRGALAGRRSRCASARPSISRSRLVGLILLVPLERGRCSRRHA